MNNFKPCISKFQQIISKRPIRVFVHFFLILGLSFMMWKGLIGAAIYFKIPFNIHITYRTNSPFHRGDILLMAPYNDEPILPGDIIVYNLKHIEIPIIHRVISVQEMEGNDYFILTKGDENMVDDRGLYEAGQYWLHKSDVEGKVIGYLPYFGHIAILYANIESTVFLVLIVIVILVEASRKFRN